MFFFSRAINWFVRLENELGEDDELEDFFIGFECFWFGVDTVWVLKV